MPKRTSVVERGQLLRLNPEEETERPRKPESKKSSPASVKANLTVRADLWKRLKQYAVNRDLRYNQVLEAALERFLPGDQASDSRQ